MTIAGYVPYFTIYSNAGVISLASEGIIAIPAPVVPPIEPPVSGGGGYAGGGGASRGRMIRKRRKREDEEEPIPVIGSTPVAAPPPPPPSAVPPIIPSQPGLMAGISAPPITVLRSPPVENEDEIEIALLLELLS
jgi:hypothetical protein